MPGSLGVPIDSIWRLNNCRNRFIGISAGGRSDTTEPCESAAVSMPSVHPCRWRAEIAYGSALASLTERMNSRPSPANNSSTTPTLIRGCTFFPGGFNTYGSLDAV